MEEVKAAINFYVYRNGSNGYSVVKTKEGFTAVGNLPEFDEGTELILIGEWKEHAKYGRQLVVSGYKELEQNSSELMKNFITSKLVKGIGENYADNVINKFGEDSIDVLINEPEKLLDVEGIGKKRLEIIKESLSDNIELFNLAEFLIPFGVTVNQLIKINKHFGSEAKSIIKNNPYKLVNEFWRINFKKADSIAKNLEFNHFDTYRIKEGIIHTLNESKKNGHCLLPLTMLLPRASVLLNVDSDLIMTFIEELEESQYLIIEDDNVSLFEMYFAERGIEEILKQFMMPPRELSKLEKQIIKKLKNRFSDEQLSAIEMSVENQVMILTGGPGTGKTTTVKGIINLYNQLDLKIMLAAPTGRAAKRIEEITGESAKTIHRLLDYNPKEDYFVYNRDNKLKMDLLIVDEASMIDTLLMFNLLSAIEPSTTLIFIGDMDQLPPVGPGNPLKDILESDLIPTVKLTEIFRQSLESKIILAAHSINKGELPQLNHEDYSDLIFIEENDEDKIRERIINLVSEELPEEYSFNPKTDIQVLSPMYKGRIGVDQLNSSIQKSLNNNPQILRRGNALYRQGDKVMQLRNNYFKNAYNGDIGYLLSSDKSKGTVAINYSGRLTNYKFDEADEFKLAYCITIHKSQGSEFPCVVLPITNSQHIMLQRNLLYTAITRASKLLVLIGSKDAVEKAVNTNRADDRFTSLFKKFSFE
ncbi:MAG: ATP-dependent RecD-like DNA helicase [Ignavibacteriae bacterium]|nr:ATP-dependent RecD-like DNA helicase [Ignavibacteriota bacterium]NOG96501.1 ATP-dependent RecD-like DNA helicase [Ignavibacteriota bacterium]